MKTAIDILNSPRHLILNILRIRYYKNSCYVFIYVGFTVHIKFCIKIVGLNGSYSANTQPFNQLF